MYLTVFTHVFLFYLINSLSINNVTLPIKLTNIFENETTLIINITPVFMTYYINATDSTRTKYLWYGMFASLNDSVSTVGSYIKSSIFTSNFTSYKNSTPFTIDTNDKEWGVVGNSMCTSPITKDIITCWLSETESGHSNIECKLYHSKTNTFSDVIQITSNNITSDRFMDVLCFNDSYFIPWIRYDHLNGSSIVLGDVLDLNGNILFNQINLSSTFSSPFVVPQIFTTKGGNKFNVKRINKDATEIFMMYGFIIDTISNAAQMINMYGYYTNINASTCPINIYNHSINQFTPPGLNPPGLWTNTLNFKDDCCYVSIYIRDPSRDVTDHLKVFGMVTDIYGNYIKFDEYPNSKNILLVNDTAYATDVQIVSLPMISNDSIQYFMIVYGNETLNRYDNYVAGNVAGSVYYLQWNNIDRKYHLFHDNTFNLVNLVNGSASEFIATAIESFSTYVMPETNKLFISWEQDGTNDNTNDNMNDNLYGQTFEIK